MPAKGRPTSQKGTIQNFGEGGHWPKAGQQARREQCKVFWKEDAGRRAANKPQGNNTKFWGRRTQQATREQYKILGKEDAGQRPAHKPQGKKTKFWGRRTLSLPYGPGHT